MTKKIKIVSILSSIISHLYALVVGGMGVALLISNFAGAEMLAVLAEIDGCYTALGSAIGIEAWIIILVTTLVPALLIEIFTYVQTFSLDAKVDETMLVLIAIIMALCSALWVWFVLTVLGATMYSVICIGAIVLVVLLQVLFTVLLFVCAKPLHQQADSAVSSPVEEQAETEEVVREEEEQVSQDAVEQKPEEVVEETVESVESEDTVEAEPAVTQEEAVQPAIDIPYQSQETMSTVELLSSVYGKVDTDAPISNEVLAKIDKLIQYRTQGIISADECDMLCSGILRQSNN